MKPETCTQWEQALSRFSNAEKLLRDEKFEEASREAIPAFFLAVSAVEILSDELAMAELSEIAKNALFEGFKRADRHYTPKETIEWVRRTLKRLSDGLPPDTFRPLR
jgi:hypothetical protein